MQVRALFCYLPPMSDERRPFRDLNSFVLPETGELRKTGDPWEPYQLLDPFGRPINAARCTSKT